MALSEQAAKLEAAANADDGATIRRDHNDMMERYEIVAEAITALIPSDVPEEGKKDDDFMEFLPDSED